jgi:hypothetical protein
MILFNAVRDDEKSKLELFFLWLSLLLGSLWWIDDILEVGLNCSFKIFDLFMVWKSVNCSKVNKDLKVVFLGKTVEFVLEVGCIFNVFFETEYDPIHQVYWLADDCVQNSCIVKALT